MKFKNKFLLILFLAVSCLIVIPGVIHFSRQQQSSVVPEFISMSESSDIKTFLKISAEQAGLDITVDPALPDQWQVTIKDSAENALNHWLDHLAAEGINVQSIQVLNTGKAGIVRVPSLTLIASTKHH